MDAARTPIKQIVLLSAVALLVAAPAAAQTLQVSSNDVTLVTTEAVNVTVTSSGPAVPFLVAKAAGDTWYSVTPLQGTATSTSGVVLAIQLQNASCAIGGATCNGTITLTGGTDTKTIAVHFGNANPGTGTVTANPTSVALVASGTTLVQQDVTLSSTSAVPITFGPLEVSYQSTGVAWLGAQLIGTTVSASAPNTLRITASPTGLPNGVYTATITVRPSTGSAIPINVTLTVGATSSTGTIRPTANPVSFDWTSTSGSLFQTVGLTSTNPAVTAFSATASSTGGWLTINGFTTATGNVAGGLPLSVNDNAAALLANGDYVGYVTIANPNNASDTSVLTVNLSVNGGAGSGLFSPSTVTFSAALGGAQQQQTVTPTGSGFYSWTVPSTCNTWLGVTQNSSGGFVLTAYPTALAANGTYTCDVSFAKDGSAYGTLPVTLNIGTGGGTTTGNPVGPTTLNFAYQAGGGNSPPQQQITVGGTGALSISVNQGSGSAFISASAGGTTAPGYIFVNVLGGLPAGTYSGTIAVTTPSGTTAVAVNLLVSANPVLIVNPSTINFSYNTGDTSYNTNLSVSMSDGSSRAVSVSTPDNWILVSGGTSGNTPSSYQVTVNPASLASGLRTGSIVVTSAGAPNSPLTIPVLVLVNNSSSGGLLTLGANALTFTAIAGGGAPAPQTLGVTAASATTFTASVSTSPCAWLSISPSGTLTTPQNLTVAVNQASLAASTTAYTCNLALTAGGVTQTVPVSLTVNAPTGGSGNITANPTSLTFTAQTGNTPLSQVLRVTNSTSGTAGVAFTVNASTTSGGNWLSAGVANGTSRTAPVDLIVSASTTGLSEGTYQGTITLTPNGGNVVRVNVTLNVQGTSVSVITTPLTFAYKTGDQNPAGQTLQVTGASGLQFTASAASTGNWLSVSPTSGNTGTTLTISANPGSLSPGTYNGTVTVAGANGATGSSTVNVTLTVTAPAPTIDRVTNAASNVATGAVAPGEIITIFGTNLGPATLVPYQIDSTGKFATTVANTQVLVNGIAAPLIYSSATQVAAIVPYDIASPFVANVPIKVVYLTQSSNTVTVAQSGSVPALFTANSTGSGPAALLNANNSYNLPGNPAARGEIIQIFLTGEGQTTPDGVTGKITTVTFLPNGFPFTPQPRLPVSVLIDSQPAQVVFFGEAPGLVSGVMQINAVVPSTARAGNVPIQVLIGGGVTQAGVTVSLK